jgi:hypothetical protein
MEREVEEKAKRLFAISTVRSTLKEAKEPKELREPKEPKELREPKEPKVPAELDAVETVPAKKKSRRRRWKKKTAGTTPGQEPAS